MSAGMRERPRRRSDRSGQVFKKVIFQDIFSHQASVQTEKGAVSRAEILHRVAGFLLGSVAAESVLSHLEGSLSVKGFQRLPPVHVYTMIRIQMQIAFRYIPDAVFLGGLGIFFFVCRQRQAVGGRVRADPVPAVAVFTVQIVGQQNLGLEAADPFGDDFINPVFRPVFVLL